MWASAVQATVTHGPRVSQAITGLAIVTRFATQVAASPPVQEMATTVASRVRRWFGRPEECPVCKVEMDERTQDLESVVIRLPLCGHKYHLACLNHLKEVQDICAVCEHDLYSTAPVANGAAAR